MAQFRSVRGEVGQNWIGVQQKTFLRWLNGQLGDIVDIDSIDQLDNGVFLIQCVENLTGKKIGKYSKNPRSRFQKLENINALLKFLKGEGVNLINVGASDIEQCNPKIILGLIWKIIYRFQISQAPQSQTGALQRLRDPQKELLAWVGERVGPYGLAPVQNYTESFRDGKVLAALVDSLQPGSVDMKNLGDPLNATRTALNVAEEKHGVPKLLDAEDIVNNPDPRSVMTYVASIRDSIGKPKVFIKKKDPAPPKKFGRWGRSHADDDEKETKKETKSAPQRAAPPPPGGQSPTGGKPVSVADVNKFKDYLNRKGIVDGPLDQNEMKEAIQKAGSVNNAIDMSEYARTPKNPDRSFGSVKSLAKFFDQVPPQQEKIKGNMLKWVNKNKDALGLDKKQYEKGIGKPEIQKLYEQGKSGPRTMQNLRKILADGKKAKNLDELASLIRKADAAADSVEEIEKEELKKFLVAPSSGIFEDEAPTHQLRKAKKGGSGLDTFQELGGHISGIMPYMRNFQKEIKDKKRKPFKTAKDAQDALAAAIAADEKAIGEYLSSPESRLLSGQAKKGLTPEQVETLLREGGAGPATLSYLKELEKEGKSVDDVEDLIPLIQQKNEANALKDPVVAAAAEAAENQLGSPWDVPSADGAEKLYDYLADPNTTLLGSEALEPKKKSDTQGGLDSKEGYPTYDGPSYAKEVGDALLASGKNVDDILDALQYLNEQGKKFDSVPALLAAVDAARPLREAQKEEIKKILNGPPPGANLLTPEARKELAGGKVGNPEAEKILKQGGAGPRTADILRELAGEGKKFDSIDALADAVRDRDRAQQASEKKAAHDIGEKLKQNPDSVKALVAAYGGSAQGLKNDLDGKPSGKSDDFKKLMNFWKDLEKKKEDDLSKWLNRTGHPWFAHLPPEARGKIDMSRPAIKKLMKDSGLGLDTLPAAKALAASGRKFNNLNEVAAALRDQNEKKKKKEIADKDGLLKRLQDPASPLFTPSGNASKKITPENVNELYDLEKSGPGTHALLDELEKRGQKFDNFPALLAAAKALSNANKDPLQKYLSDPSCPLFSHLSPEDRKALDTSSPAIDQLVQDGGAGPLTLPIAKELAAAGRKFDDLMDLAPAIKEAYEKRKKPDSKYDDGKHDSSPFDPLAADREALRDYLGQPDVHLTDNAGPPASLPNKDLDELLSEGEGLQNTLDLLPYLNAEGDRYDSVPELTDALKKARILRRRAKDKAGGAAPVRSAPPRPSAAPGSSGDQKYKDDLKDVLNSPYNNLLPTSQKPVGDPVVDQVYEDGGAGPESGACARELAGEGKAYPNPEALAEAIRDKDRERKQRKAKQKEALKEYLQDPECDLFTPSGNANKTEDPITDADIDKLWDNEKSGPGTAALLDQLREDGAQFNSIPELLGAAKDRSKDERKKLEDYLMDPKNALVTDKTGKGKPTKEKVARLAEESEAGPATRALLKELEPTGRKFPDSDLMIPVVKDAMQKKKAMPASKLTPDQRKAGLGATPIDAALIASDLIPDDVARLKEYLQNPECDLLYTGDEKKDDEIKLPVKELQDTIDEGRGIDNTLDLLPYLDEAGKHYDTLPELTEHVKDAEPLRKKVKDRMKALLNDPSKKLVTNPQPVSDKDVEAVYEEAGVGPKSAAVLREMADDGKKFSSLPELAHALKEEGRKRRKKDRQDKDAIKEYLETPDCAAFTPQGNKTKPKEINPHDMNKLYKNEKTGPGTISLLNALEEHGIKAASVPDLLAQGKDMSGKKRKELTDYLGPKRKDLTPELAAAIAEESEAGTAACADLKGAEQRNPKFNTTEDLIPHVKAQHNRRKDLPKNQLNKEERLGGDGIGSASIGVNKALAAIDPDAERQKLLDYLSNPDVGLIDDIESQHLRPKDMDPILQEADSAKDAIDLCEYLDHDGRHFPNPEALADHLRDARPKRNDVKEQEKALLKDPKKKLLAGSNPSHSDLDKIYDEPEAGPRTAAHLRELAADGKQAKNPDDLIDSLKNADKVAKRKKRHAKQALKDYLNTPDCPAFTPEGNRSKGEVTPRDINDLFKLEKSGPGTAALLDLLENQGQKFDSIPDLLEAAEVASAQKRKELKDHLSDPTCPVFSEVKDKDSVKPNMDAVARLAEESEAGPATLPVVKEIGAAGRKVGNSDDLIPLVKRAYAAKKPQGSASKWLAGGAARNAESKALADADALSDYLSSPDVGLLNGMEDEMKLADLEDVIAEGGGLPDTLAALKEMNEDGETYKSIPELVEGLKRHQGQEAGTKQEMEDLLTEPGQHIYSGADPLTRDDIDALYTEGGAGEDTPAILRDLEEEGKPRKTYDDLVNAIKDGKRKKNKDNKLYKERLAEYLASPDCPLFTPQGNKEKNIGPNEVKQFWGVEKTGPGTGALINALEEQKPPKKYDSFPELLEAAKDLHDKREQELLDHLADPSSAVTGDEKSDDPRITPAESRKLAKESTAGPATEELLKQLEASGMKKPTAEDLIPAVKQLHDKKRKVPRSQLTPQEKIAGVGPSPLDGPRDKEGKNKHEPISQADVEAMMDYLASPDNNLLDDGGSVELADVEGLLDEAGGLDPAIDLCNYLDADDRTFQSVPDLEKALPDARARRAKEKQAVKDFINDPRNKKLLGGTDKGDAAAEKILDDGMAGPHTSAILRDLASEGKSYPNPDALAEAVHDAYQKDKDKKKKHKAAIKDYLEAPNTDLLTPAANQSKDVSDADVDDLWRNEKSGPGTVALLNELKGGGKKYNSVPELLAAAKDLSGKKRKQLKDYLSDPKSQAFSEVKDKSKVKPSQEAVDRLAEESEAGPATQRAVKDLEDIGRKFDSTDEMIPFVKKLAKNGLGPLGAALTAAEEDKPSDTDALLDYLSNPDCVLLDETKDITDPELQDMLDEGQGLDNTIDLCEYLNKDGKPYDNVPALTKALDSARPRKRKVKDRMKDILNEDNGLLSSGGPVSTKDVEDLYTEAKAGPESAALLREMTDEGRKFPNLDALAEGLKEAAKKKKKKQQKEKVGLKQYLESPDCPAFTPAGNKDKKVPYGAVRDLYNLEHSGPGTVALLNALEEQGKKFSSMPELVAAAKDLSKRQRKGLADHMENPKAPIFSAPPQGAEEGKDGRRDGPETAAILAEEAESGPATDLHVRGFEKDGKKFTGREPLIPAVKAAHEAKMNMPKSALTKEERAAGLGIGSANKALPSSTGPSQKDLEELMEYLADPETELLDDGEELKIPELEALLEEGGGTAKNTIDLCEYLNEQGKRYSGVPDLTDHLKDALPLRKKVKGEIGKVLNNPKRTPVHDKKGVSEDDIDKLYDKAEAGPRSAATLRELGFAAKEEKDGGYKNLDELGEAMKETAQENKRNKKLAKMAIRDYLNSPGNAAFNPGKKDETTTGDVNALYRVENSGPGTIALLNALEAQKKKFSTFPELLTASKGVSASRRKELADNLSSAKAVPPLPAPISPPLGYNSGEVVRLAEESQAGPATVIHLRELEAEKKVKVDDSDELIPHLKKMHAAKKDGPFAGLSIEGGYAGLGDGMAGRAYQKAAKEKKAKEKEDIDALMEYLASPECLMMNEVKELETADLEHLLDEGQTLRETLNLCKFLNHDCHRFDSVPELTEEVHRSRLQVITAKRLMRDMMTSTMNHILPGWGQDILPAEIDEIYGEANCGLCVIPYLRELIDGRKTFKSRQQFTEDMVEMHEGAVVKRRQELATIRDWLHGKHGEPCKLWSGSAKSSPPVEIKQVRELWRVEKSSYGTAALLTAMQKAGKTADSWPAFIAMARSFSAERRAQIQKAFHEKKDEIFRPTGKPIVVTAEAVDLLCDESQAGPATLTYVPGLAAGKKKYLQWEDIILVVKRLHYILRDPFWILKEGDPPKERKAPEAPVVEVEHWNVDALAEYLLRKECNLVRNKKDINDRLLTWLLREAKGIQQALRYIKMLDYLGASFESVRLLTLGVRRAMKCEEDLKTFLQKNGKLLTAVDSSTPLSGLTVEHTGKVYEQVEASLFTMNLVEQLAREGKSFKTLDAFISGASSARAQAHDALMEMFGDLDCVLLNHVESITLYSLNEILQAGGTVKNTLDNLREMNEGQRTFLNPYDLTLALRARTGIQEPF